MCLPRKKDQRGRKSATYNRKNAYLLKKKKLFLFTEKFGFVENKSYLILIFVEGLLKVG